MVALALLLPHFPQLIYLSHRFHKDYVYCTTCYVVFTRFRSRSLGPQIRRSQTDLARLLFYRMQASDMKI
jgi:hypothetical protein